MNEEKYYKMHHLNIPREVVQKVACPQCGFLFSEMHSRAIACAGCSEGVLGDCGFKTVDYYEEDWAYNKQKHVGLIKNWVRMLFILKKVR